MSVLIRGMEMPKSCYVCPFMFHERRQPEVWCTAVESNWLDIRNVLSDDRHDACPLVPVPPHGDLIDREPFIQFIKTHWDSYDQWVVEQLEARPTIIPAEEGKT